MTNAHFVRDVLQYNTRDLYINLHKRVNVFFLAFRKAAPTRADLHVGNRRRARNNGRSTDNVRTDCGFDWSNFRLAGHVDRSKFNRIENEINLRFLLFSCYLSSRCVLRNFDMKSWRHTTRAVVYNSRIETDIRD